MGSKLLFVGAFCIILSMYGGGFATVPAYLADMFGTQFVGAIHGRLLTAWATAGIIGPVVVNYIREAQLAAGVPRDNVEEMPRLRRIGRLVYQRLHISPDCGQGRSELVRHVGHEVAANLVRPSQIGDVVQHDDGAGRLVGAHGGASHGGDDAGRQRQFDALALAPAQRFADLGGDVWIPHHFQVVRRL